MNPGTLQAWLAMAADHLWQASLFALVAWGAVRLLKNAPARTRSAVWIAASLKFALPLALFAWIGAQTGINLTTETATHQAAVASPVTMLVAPAATEVRTAAGAPTTRTWVELLPQALALVWFAGFAAALGFWLAGRRRLTLAIRAGRTIYEGRERNALERARSRVGVETPVGLMTSPAVHEPGVWCVLRPIVVLPDGVSTELNDEELEAVMMHEVAHVVRHDNLIANVHMLLCCVFWFHPMVWWIDRQLLAERERACDEAVLQAGGGSRVYAAGLLKVFRFTIGWRPAGVSCATGSHFGRRIQVIMGDSKDRIATTWHRAVTAGVIVLLAGVSVTAAAFNGAADPQQRVEEQKDVIIETGNSGPGMGPGLAKAASEAPTLRTVRYENLAGAPVAISSAEIKKVPAAELAKAMGDEGRLRKFEIRTDGPQADKIPEGQPLARKPFPETDAEGNAMVLLITIQNVSARTVSGYQIGGKIGPDDDVFFMFQRPFDSGASFTIAMPVGHMLADSDATVLAVRGAQFDDGSTWGEWKNDPGMEMMKRKSGK